MLGKHVTRICDAVAQVHFGAAAFILAMEQAWPLNWYGSDRCHGIWISPFIPSMTRSVSTMTRTSSICC